MGIRNLYSVREVMGMQHNFFVLDGTSGTTVSSSGSLDLSIDLGNGTVGNMKKCRIHQVQVYASASTDYDFRIHGNADRVYNDDIVYDNINNNRTLVDQFEIPYLYEDFEPVNGSLHPGGSLHMTFINTDSSNNSTFTYKIYCTKVE